MPVRGALLGAAPRWAASVADSEPTVGVLALQGDFAAHAMALAARGLVAMEVRSAAQLRERELAGLVLPGGESTAMLRLMEGSGLAEAITAGSRAGLPLLATCAGVILLAREVRNPAQASLGLLDVAVERNSYGRQLASAVVPVRTIPGHGLEDNRLEAVFIRAPRIVEVGPGVQVLARRDDDPVLVRQGQILAATFHPELSPGSPVLELFREMVEARSRSPQRATTTAISAANSASA